MRRFLWIASAACLAGAASASGAPYEVAATDGVRPADLAIGPAAIHRDYALGTEMVVDDWVLCTTRPTAEALLRAHDRDATEAARITADLLATEVCGRFGRLRVILRERLGAAGRATGDTRAFAAEISLAGTWAPGFVVTGIVNDMPEPPR